MRVLSILMNFPRNFLNSTLLKQRSGIGTWIFDKGDLVDTLKEKESENSTEIFAILSDYI